MDAAEGIFPIEPLSLVIHGSCFLSVKVLIIECLYTHANAVLMYTVFQTVPKPTQNGLICLPLKVTVTFMLYSDP